MTIRVPDTLTADNSEKYEVSIRLWPGGLSFSGYIPKEKDSFFSEKVLFDSDEPMSLSLKNTFFDNQCFMYLYKSFYVICASEKYTLAPENVFSEKDKSLLFSLCHQHDETGKILVQQLSNLQSFLLFNIDNEAYEFLVRSLVNPIFIHSLSPLLLSWQKNSLTSYPKQIHTFIHNNLMDIACFEHGEMLLVNSFNCENENDIVYYIMYACKQLEINQLEDSICFHGDEAKCLFALTVVKNYIRNADYSPSLMRKYSVAVGKDVFMDVVTLAECAL
jgi:hypothetical protein